MAEAVITGREISERLTLRVVGLRPLMLRWSVAVWIIRLASLVAGCNLDLSLSGESDDQRMRREFDDYYRRNNPHR